MSAPVPIATVVPTLQKCREGPETAIQYFVPVDLSQCRDVRQVIHELGMRRRLLQFLFIGGLAATALMLAIPASAQSPGFQKGIVPCESRIIDSKPSVEATRQAHILIAWIAAQANWTVHDAPPIRLIPSAEIQKIFTAEEETGFNIGAFYSEKDHTVYLPDNWHPNDLHDRSILLHELVHHLQYLNHVKELCPGEFEFQAFKYQVDWLSEQGVEYPVDLIGIDPLEILMLGRCDEMSF